MCALSLRYTISNACTHTGMAATSASGTNAVRYGTMRENVLNLEVVLPSGEILHTSGKGGRARKTSAGLNLTNLFVGSEGTLGMITSATVRLHPVPGVVAAAICSFENAGDAIRTSTETIQCGVQVGRVEFMDDIQVRASNAYSKLDLEERSTILFEFGGMSEESLQEQASFVEEIAKNNGGSNFRWATAQEDRANLWKARHAVYVDIILCPTTYSLNAHSSSSQEKKKKEKGTHTHTLTQTTVTMPTWRCVLVVVDWQQMFVCRSQSWRRRLWKLKIAWTSSVFWLRLWVM